MDALTKQVVHMLHGEADVTPEFAEFWVELFKCKASQNPRIPGECEESWLKDLIEETSTEVKAICYVFLTDRDALGDLTRLMAGVAKEHFGDVPSRKSWDELSDSAKSLISMWRHSR